MRLVKDKIRTSLWFAPVIAAGSAIALAIVLVTIDHQLGQSRHAWYLFDGGPQAAQELLSAITSSMLTLTALVFSITVLVLQLASSQFSPRVIRTFLESRSTKLAMAMFVGTFLYAMLVLSQVRTAPTVFVPALATWGALLLVMLSVGVFIHYVHHMAHSVRAITVIVRVAEETRHHIELMYPEQLGDEAPELPTPSGAPDQQIYNTTSPGIVAGVEADELLELARVHETVIEVVPRIGDFVSTGALVFRLWGGPVDDEHALAAIAIEPERTPVQDPGFGFRQLVDIAVRALSPSLNDPSTAAQVIDHLQDLVRNLARRRFPSRTRADDSGTLRVIAARPSFGDYVTLAFDEIRHYGASSPQPAQRLHAAIEDCLAVAPPPRRRMLAEQLGLLDRSKRQAAA